ncbi:MAG: inositol monophosphatase [Nitrospira sp.]|nr:inositol monophosphatase [bacterium]MBL7049611.1 inositol monophosphatase [Nitrospira sp.]
MANERSEFLGTALRAALLAGDCILRNLGHISRDDIDIKQASDFVTRVDREAEDLIINTIKKSFPDHKILAEETLREESKDHYRWIIDPLDGTTNYIHQYPMFSVSIALEYEGQIILGLVYDPLRNEIFTAEKNRGAFLNGRSISVSKATIMNECLIATGFPFKNKEHLDNYLILFKKIITRVSDLRRAGSAALDLAHLACGRLDGFFELGLKPWDIAAGSILVQEAGGIITDFSGATDYLTTCNIVAAAPSIQIEILNEVRSVFSGIIDR